MTEPKKMIVILMMKILMKISTFGLNKIRDSYCEMHYFPLRLEVNRTGFFIIVILENLFEVFSNRLKKIKGFYFLHP